MRADQKSRLHYACSGLIPPAATTISGTSQTPGTAPYPTSQTFLLHSRPASTKKIYLDFKGHTTSGTAWNTAYKSGANIVTPPYDINGTPSTFSNQELTNIQLIWQQVGEDYSAFDVDVTTEDPGVEALRMTSTSDTAFGKRVVIGGSSMDWLGASAGGIAYIGSFNWNVDTPVFAFPVELANGDPKNVAESCAHEVGHTLGLSHDGATDGTEYYMGNAIWAPIMGAGYYVNIVQWSKGEYPLANNTEDDIAIVASMIGFAADEAGGDSSHAVMLTGTSPQVFGVVGTAAEKDVYAFNTGAGSVSLALSAAAPSPNLCAQLTLKNSTGTTVATMAPTTLMGGTLTTTLAAGSYYLEVAGAGLGDWTNGFNNYGSFGQYLLTGSLIAANSPPTAVVSNSAPLSGKAPVTVNFSSTGSTDTGGSISSYLWDFGDGTTSTTASPAHSYTVVGSYTAKLRVTDNSGLIGFASTTVTVTANSPPVASASASPLTGAAPLAVTLSSTGSSDPEGGALTYLWNFGDGTTSTVASPSHSYATAGSFVATLTVTDNVGQTKTASTATITVTAGNLPPIAKATATPSSQFVSTAVAFSSTGSSDPEKGTLTYLWTFGDGTTSTTASPSKTYTTAGTYTVTLKVTDNKAASTTASVVVLIAAKKVYIADVVTSLVTVSSTTWGAKATVTVKDALGNLASGATVTGTWSGVYAKTGVTGKTGTSGTTLGVTAISSTTATKKGTYTFTVTGITLSGFTYDSTKNVKSAGSVNTPP